MASGESQSQPVAEDQAYAISWQRGRFVDPQLEREYRLARLEPDRRMTTNVLVLLAIAVVGAFYLDVSMLSQAGSRALMTASAVGRILGFTTLAGCVFFIRRARTEERITRLYFVGVWLFAIAYAALAAVYMLGLHDTRLTFYFAGIIVLAGATVPSDLRAALVLAASIWCFGLVEIGLGLVSPDRSRLELAAFLTAALGLATVLALIFQRSRRLDYVALRRIDDARRNMERQAVQAQQFSEMAAISAAIAHDLNNVLQLLVIAPEELRGGDLPDSDRESLLDDVSQATERAIELVKRLLILGRDAPSERQEVDLVQTVRSLERVITKLLRPEIRFVLEADDESVPVVAEPPALSRVIVNLIANARDAIPEAGEIRARCHRVDSEGGSESRLEVIDNGSGMSSDVKSRVFEPFYTTKGEGGTGMGLVSVRRIVEAHGGHVEIESHPGEGTRVVVRFPCPT